MDDVRLSVCLAPCHWISSYTSPSTLTQAWLSSPAATGHCQWKWISELINPWPDLPPSFSWFFQEPHPSIISWPGFAVVWQQLLTSLFLSLPPLAHSSSFDLSELPCVLDFSPFCFFLRFHPTRHTGREIGFFPNSGPAVQKWGMSTSLRGDAARGRGDPKCNLDTLLPPPSTCKATASLLTSWHMALPLPGHCSALLEGIWLCRLHQFIMPGLAELWRKPELQSTVQIPKVQGKFLFPFS